MLSSEMKEAILVEFALTGSAKEAGARLGVHERTAQRVVRAHSAEVRTKVPTIPGMEVDRISTTVDKHGDIQSHSVRQRLEAGDPDPGNLELKAVSSFVDPDGSVKAEWRKYTKVERSPEEIAEAVREGLADIERVELAEPLVDLDPEHFLTVYVLPDLHVGMRAHGAECGRSFDLKIAERSYAQAFATLMEFLPTGTKHAVTLFLGDIYHSDSQLPLTPQNKHLLDVDGRWRKVFATGARICANMIDAAASRHREVEVVVRPGNHDPNAARVLDVALSMRYEREPRVHAPGSEEHHWFRRHGKTLVGATHGHTIKPANMGDLLINECRADFGETDYHYVLFGHLHHETLLRTRNGVLVEGFGAPCPRTTYEAAGGFPAGGRSLTAIVYHPDLGEIARFKAPVVV